MTGAAPVTFPGSRALSDWWRQLGAWRPRALWVGHLLLHRVEAPVRLARPLAPDRFALLVLRALALEESRSPAAIADPLEGLDRRLHLGPAWLRTLLGRLQADGLVGLNGNGLPRLTSLGRQALGTGAYTDPRPERRIFYFAESGQADRPAHFLDLAWAETTPRQAPDGWRFDLGVLEACIARPTDWKQRHGFPQDVQAVVRAETDLLPPWQRVILDQAEDLLAALVLAPNGEKGERLLGFAAQPEGWALRADRPVLTLDADWMEPFPELGRDPSPEQWREAWLAWCQPRGLPPAETAACALERRGQRLRVMVSPRLREQIETGHGDALRGRAWVLGGDGPIRTAAPLEIASA